MNTYSEFVEDLRAAGYRERAPSDLAAALDKNTAANFRCEQCGGVTVYRPWTKPGSYRAFAVCERCDSYSEF